MSWNFDVKEKQSAIAMRSPINEPANPSVCRQEWPGCYELRKGTRLECFISKMFYHHVDIGISVLIENF